MVASVSKRYVRMNRRHVLTLGFQEVIVENLLPFGILSIFSRY